MADGYHIEYSGGEIRSISLSVEYIGIVAVSGLMVTLFLRWLARSFSYRHSFGLHSETGFFLDDVYSDPCIITASRVSIWRWLWLEDLALPLTLTNLLVTAAVIHLQRSLIEVIGTMTLKELVTGFGDPRYAFDLMIGFDTPLPNAKRRCTRKNLSMLHRRYRGRIVGLTRDPDGEERCVLFVTSVQR